MAAPPFLMNHKNRLQAQHRSSTRVQSSRTQAQSTTSTIPAKTTMTMRNSLSYSSPRSSEASLLALALFFCSVVLLPSTQANDDGSGSPSNLLRRRATTSVICRLTQVDTLSSQGTYNKDTEQTYCTPIVNDEQISIDTEIVALPADIKNAYKEEIVHGTLMVSITDAELDDVGRLLLGQFPTYNVLDDVHFDRHRHLNYVMDPNGTKTISVVRISTRSKQQADSVSDIQSTIFDGSTSFLTQVEDCSHGKLKLKKSAKGTISLTLPGSNSDYKNDAATLVTEAQLLLQSEGYGKGSDLADRTIFCLPEGFGNWAARAGMNHWRITMNHGWCLSLSAAMHELGHTLGLGHADEMGGYMGASYRKSEWPRKCFNGYNNHHIGWYSDREQQWNANLDAVKLATFVDYDKAASDEPVIVNVANKYFIQYNCKKDFNANTDGIEDLGTGKVTIHESLPAEDTAQLGALVVGESLHLSSPNVYVKACEAYTSSSGADVVHISFSSSSSDLCKEDVLQSKEDNSSSRSDGASGNSFFFGSEFFAQLINAIIMMVFGGEGKADQ